MNKVRLIYNTYKIYICTLFSKTVLLNLAKLLKQRVTSATVKYFFMVASPPSSKHVYVQEQTFTISMLFYLFLSKNYLGKLIRDQPAVSHIVHCLLYMHSFPFKYVLFTSFKYEKNSNLGFHYES